MNGSFQQVAVAHYGGGAESGPHRLGAGGDGECIDLNCAHWRPPLHPLTNAESSAGFYNGNEFNASTNTNWCRCTIQQR